MKHAKLLIAAALSAASWGTVSQAQTVIYDVTPGTTYYYGYGSSTGTTPSESNWTAYPTTPSMGYSTSTYWDNGVLRQRNDPVIVGGPLRNYVYPESSVQTYIIPESQVQNYMYTYPRVEMYSDPVYDLRY